MKENKKKGSIRRRLVLVFALSSCVVFFANMFMYYNINKSINSIDEVYRSNVSLNELIDELTDVQEYVYEYLNTKSSESLENYYRSEQNYRNLINELNSDIIDNEMTLMQKNIKNMSGTYLNLIDKTVDAKRGRNIEKYKINYEEATLIYDYISTYINSLNNEQFKFNSNNYELLIMSLRYLEIITTTILIVITAFNIILIIVVTRSITGPLMKLTKAAYEVAGGNFEVDLVQVNSSDEVEIVTRAFNNMIVSIHQYIITTRISMELENKMKEKDLMMTNHLKDAQLKYLQAQINPHFLFNTLNAGAQIAMMEGADKTCVFIENMADFFRFNMKSFDQDSTIRDEIKLVDSYVYILNVRFSGKINFSKEIDDDIINGDISNRNVSSKNVSSKNVSSKNSTYNDITNNENENKDGLEKDGLEKDALEKDALSKVALYKDSINYDLLETRVPSMILQPVVENAVNYGIRDIEYAGEIRLKVTQDEEFINITITDNGLGMEQSTIERIMKSRIEDPAILKERNISKDSNGIGLGNVINRLRLYFDREEIFEITSEGHNKGTKVTIHVPKNTTCLRDISSEENLGGNYV